MIQSLTDDSLAAASESGEESQSHGLPGMVQTTCGEAPAVLKSLDDADVPKRILVDLACKLAVTVSQFDTAWAAQQLCLPLQLTEEIYWHLKQEKFVEILGQEGHFCYRYAATDLGRQHALRLTEICGYVGPAPVSLEAYCAMLARANETRPTVSLDMVRDALGELVLPEDTIQIASLAAASGRSLFLFGPAGNGKTSLGRALHQVMGDSIWIPFSLSIGDTVIRLYDSHCHHRVKLPAEVASQIDQRWLPIHRPMIVAGGEMTMDELDLAYSPALRYYEAPPHLKANGGLMLIDDFGRQRIDPHELLNRWIIPLEHRIDHLTLHSGQKIVVPFELLLIVATNLNVADVSDPAFLRRMGYRLHLQPPTIESYKEIFHEYAKRIGLSVPDGTIEKILSRYSEEQRDLRASEPRDLLERSRDICQLRQQPLTLDDATLDLAWNGYFGGTGN